MSQRPSTTSPFSQRPSFTKKLNTPKDDIDTSFEDIGSSPTCIRPSADAHRSFHGKDGIQDDAEAQDDFEPEQLGPGNGLLKKEPLSAFETEHTSNEFRTPAPKRRRLFREADTPAEISSGSTSPVEDEDALDVVGLQESAMRSSSDFTYKDEPFVDDPVTTYKSSRFRLPSDSHVLQSSSLQKITFKSSIDDASNLSPGIDSTLPDAFSPSKRKGKKEYEPGGAAETVRSWILSAAVEESTNGPRHEETITIHRLVQIQMPLFVIVEDSTEHYWLLVADQSKHARTNSAIISRLEKGHQIIVKGRMSKWEIPMLLVDNTSNLRVAVDWDIMG